MSKDIRNQIEEALQALTEKDLRTASIDLLNTLGYRSKKTLDIGNSPEAFLEEFDKRERPFRKDKALFDYWKSIDFLFQITDDELSEQISLFTNNAVNTGLFRSYLFFAVELSGKDYARGKLSEIARQINRLFPTPVLVMIRHNEGEEVVLSIAVINRRRNKRDVDKDVLGKVTFIRNISLSQPHRGHLDILSSFALLVLAEKTSVGSFDELHAAWEQVFNVELLNKNFYRELSNWYFWARQHVHFPTDQLEFELETMDGSITERVIRQHDSKSLIRLLTRLLFVWFVKEKRLVPEQLFQKDLLKQEWLNGFDSESEDTFYYKAILQNLFFASLNQQCDKREFRKDGQNHNITNLMRYKSQFNDPGAFITLVNSEVPFMNGGLFECLDKPHPTKRGKQGGRVIMYEDGFSDRKDNTLKVPDFLFFGDQRTVDLSGDEAYGDKKRKKEKVRGIIPLLNSYKFTIVENTPIEQEVALDPELLGKVFENLLASYNPETKTTARKQTGSFYTPRTIVDYMVDESLKAYLKKALIPFMSEADAEEGLEILLAYTEKEHVFTGKEKHALINTIDNCKILDPACGSGAFPMGILHKLEFVLSKLDKNNQLWSDRQIEKVDATIAAAEEIDDVTIRDNTIVELEVQKRDIEEAFTNNELGYGRKLYLIENCIYGVDIQAIATQVSRLRFFISLIVDQNANPERDNFGIRPLPNLEAKFVAADTLIHIEKPENQLNLFYSKDVQDLEKKLKQVRHKMFGAKTPRTKNKYRQRDKELREQIAEELEANGGWSNASARQLALWDPYDQNASCSFFDPEWMFDLKGFDIVIGNPPYVQIQNFSGQPCQAQWKKQGYKTFSKTGDVYCLFYERGFELLKSEGVLSFITSNKWMRARYGKAIRKFFLENGHVNQLIDFGDSPIFKAATTYTNIMVWEKSESPVPPVVYDLNRVYADASSMEEMLVASEPDEPLFSEHSFVIAGKEQSYIKKRVERIGTPLSEWDISIHRGILTGCNEAFIIAGKTKDKLIAEDPRSADIIKPILRGRDIKRFQDHYADLWLINSHNGYIDSKGNRIPRIDIPNNYPAIWKYLQEKNTELAGRVENRADQGEHWSNLRNCAYLDEFGKEKILYAEIVYDSAFFYDTQEFYPEATTFVMTGDNMKYLTALFNSRLLTYAFKMFYAGGDLRGNTFRYKKVFLHQLPIPKIDTLDQEPFEALADSVLFAYRSGMGSEAEQLEDLIDGLVYDLYFEKEMRTAHCYITDRIRETVKPFGQNDSEDYKREYVQTLCEFFRNDKTIRHSLVHRRNVKPVEITLGAKS